MLTCGREVWVVFFFGVVFFVCLFQHKHRKCSNEPCELALLALRGSNLEGLWACWRGCSAYILLGPTGGAELLGGSFPCMQCSVRDGGHQALLACALQEAGSCSLGPALQHGPGGRGLTVC